MIFRTLASMTLLLAGAGAWAADLTVTVQDLTCTEGVVGVQVVDSEEAWDGKAQAVQRQRLPADAKEITFSFTDLAPGKYAVMVMHDENGNGELDFNVFGIPSESYGFSNNPQAFGKPRFDDARFELSAEGGAITIQLQ